jgi:hypothetical protein
LFYFHVYLNLLINLPLEFLLWNNVDFEI